MFSDEDFSDISQREKSGSFSYNTNLLDGDITCMVIDNKNKILYMGGNFKKTLYNNNEIILNNICKLSLNNEPEIVSSLGTGFNSFITCMVVDTIVNLYVKGSAIISKVLGAPAISNCVFNAAINVVIVY